MKTCHMTLTVMFSLTTLSFIGCKKEEPTPTIPVNNNERPTVPVTPVTPVTPPKTDGGPTTKPASSPTTVSVTVTPTPASALAAQKEATTKLDEALQLLKDKKYDLADAALGKVEQNKAALPEAIQSRLLDLRHSLDAAKLANTAQKFDPSLLNK
jgi:hypothetical protein